MSSILDCRPLRKKIEAELIAEITRISEEYHEHLTGVIIQVGERADSTAFIIAKKKLAEKLGVAIRHIKFPETVSEKELLEAVQAVAVDSHVHGIIVQLPLPSHIDKDRIINAIPAHKDIDGLTAINIQRTWEARTSAIVPATTRGILTLCREFGVVLEGKHVVILGRSTLVGKPTAVMCTTQNATVTVCHSKTPNLSDITKTTDVLIVAIGKPHFITKDYIRAGQTIIDVGITFVDGVMKGDVHPEVIDHLGNNGSVTPVPFGVGQMTVASLFQNLVQGFLQSKNLL